MQANEELSAVLLRGGLHGRFQSAFHLLENALEVLDDNIAHSVTPAKYDDLHPLLQQVGEQLLLLRRWGNMPRMRRSPRCCRTSASPSPWTFWNNCGRSARFSRRSRSSRNLMRL